MKIKWSNVEDSQDFGPLQPGVYPAIIESVEEKTSSNGDDYWSLKITVEPSAVETRTVFDNLFFHSPKALKRTKFALSRLGVDLKDNADLQPSILEGKRFGAVIENEQYEANDGTMKTRNVLPYAGYQRTPAKPIIHAPLATARPAASPTAEEAPALDEYPF